MVGFEETEFTETFEEFEFPLIDGFELFVECTGVKIYRRFMKTSNLYEYKVIGNIMCHTETFHRVYMDLQYRKKWDSYVKDLYEKEEDGTKYIYWNVNFPFPLANRDYTYVRESRNMSLENHNKRQTWVILSKSIILSSPEISGVVRVKDYKQNLIIQEQEGNSTKVFMHYYDNPGGSIPTWLVNWAAKKGVPNFLTDMKKACDRYEDYLQKKTST